MFRKCVGVLVSAFLVAGPAIANETPSMPEVAKFVQDYPKTPSAEAVLNQFKGEAPGEVIAFLRAKMQSAHITTLPNVRLRDATSIEIEFQHHTLVMTYLPNHQVKVNGHLIDVTSSHDLEAQWQQIVSALPHYDDHVSLWSIFENPAYADNGEYLTGGAMLGTGAATTAGGIAAAFGATAGIIVGGAVVMIGAYVFFNNGVCAEMGTEKYTCLAEKDELDEAMRKNPAQLKSMNEHRLPVCGEKSLLPNSTEVFKLLNDLTTANKELFRSAVLCRATSGALNQCLTNISTEAAYLCVKMHGMTDAYLPSYLVPGGLKKSVKGKSTN